MRKIAVLIALLAALGIGAELVAPAFAERQLENGVRAQVRDAGGVDADLRSFPLVTRVLTTSKVPRVTVTLSDVAHQQVEYATVSLELRGVLLDREAMLQRRVRVRAIESGTVTAIITLPVDLSALGELDFRVSAGTVQVGIGGRTLLRASLPTDLIPCAPEGRLEERGLVLSCTFTDIPPALIEAVQR